MISEPVFKIIDWDEEDKMEAKEPKNCKVSPNLNSIANITSRKGSYRPLRDSAKKLRVRERIQEYKKKYLNNYIVSLIF